MDVATAGWLAVAGMLLVAAAGKAGDRTQTTVALTAYGVPGRFAAPVWAGLITAEAAIAAGLAAGLRGAAIAGAVLLGVFAVVQAVMLARGRRGAPCGCFGARGRLSPLSLLRTLLLVAACAALPALGSGPQVTPVIAAAVAVAVLVLASGRPARGPAGALEIDAEGPPLGSHSALADRFAGEGLRLAVFTSAGCRLCRDVTRAADALAGRGVAVRRFDEVEDAGAWAEADVPGAPFAVALAPDGTVLAKGTVNGGAQLESVLSAAAERSGMAEPAIATAGSSLRPAAVAGGASRRDFLIRTGGAAAAIAGAQTTAALIKPGEAEGYHFCGHIYTTDSCPHPTGLPRIDRKGFPIRAKDARPVDDLGRLIDRQGRPLRDNGEALTDAEGNWLPPASRTRVCDAVADRFDIETRVDGSWYRCCGGQVRKLVDCCSPHTRRINGDGSLRGYCYANRKVFCVMYFQTKIPC
jgi:hypothetical protein